MENKVMGTEYQEEDKLLVVFQEEEFRNSARTVFLIKLFFNKQEY